MKLPEELQFIQNSRMPQKRTDARLDGKVAVITGATSGVGYQAARRFAQGGAQLALLCRNGEKAGNLQAELKADFGTTSDVFVADFCDLAQVRRAGAAIAARYPAIHVLVNNAGVFNKRRRLTDDGHEMMFQVIHLASFLLTKLLAASLKAGAPARVLMINSEGHRFGRVRMRDLSWRKRPYFGLTAYGQAKSAQLLAAQRFAREFEKDGIRVNAMHPGAVRTNIGMNNGLLYRLYSHFILRWFLKDAAISGESIYYLAAAPELAEASGKFYNLTIEETPAPHARDAETGAALWDFSMAEVGLKGKG